MRLAAILSDSQDWISSSTHLTARPPRLTGLGNLPCETRRQIVLRDKPVRVLTAGTVLFCLSLAAYAGERLSPDNSLRRRA